jgi:hypothetical protein
MQVKELIKSLQAMDPDMEVIMQEDAEGNGYSPLAGADPDAIYVADSTYSGDVYDANSTADENCMDEEEWEALQKQPRAVILYPVN